MASLSFARSFVGVALLYPFVPILGFLVCARQYRDYAVWQRDFLAAGEEQRCLEIWAAELAGRR